LDHAFAVVASSIGVRAWNGVTVFRGENDAFAVTLHEFAEKGFAAAIGVEIGGIDEVAAASRKAS